MNPVQTFVNLYLRKKIFKTLLSSIIDVPLGSVLDKYTNAFIQDGFNTLADLECVENEEELKSFGLKKLHIKRWKSYFKIEDFYKMQVSFHSKNI